MLSELLIANNPLTTEKSGDPPLLKRFLQDRLGIQLVRKKETETGKPTIEVPARKSRKVGNKIKQNLLLKKHLSSGQGNNFIGILYITLLLFIF